ncbi:hypothetical protein IWZ01DRAFT_478177 [Phyllosticta capitalensis]
MTCRPQSTARAKSSRTHFWCNPSRRSIRVLLPITGRLYRDSPKDPPHHRAAISRTKLRLEQWGFESAAFNAEDQRFANGHSTPAPRQRLVPQPLPNHTHTPHARPAPTDDAAAQSTRPHGPPVTSTRGYAGTVPVLVQGRYTLNTRAVARCRPFIPSRYEKADVDGPDSFLVLGFVLFQVSRLTLSPTPSAHTTLPESARRTSDRQSVFYHSSPTHRSRSPNSD